jgi:hypothetical protein
VLQSIQEPSRNIQHQVMGLDTSFPGTGELGAEESEEVREKDDGRDALDAFEPRLGLEESKCVPLASLVRL